jgi:hypothetical protein
MRANDAKASARASVTRGNQSAARRHIERFLADDVTHDAGSRIIRFQLDQRLAAQAFLARILWLQGFPAQAMETTESTIEQARALGKAKNLPGDFI